jgi:5-bromo-4-chloroindolyl phosphate hydrolysis protein
MIKEYKYVYDNLDELIYKMVSLDSLLEGYVRSGKNVTWETETLVTSKKTYVYKVRINAQVD